MQRAGVRVHLFGPAGHQVRAEARVQLGLLSEREGGGGSVGVKRREERRNQGVSKSRAEVGQEAETGGFGVALDCKNEKADIKQSMLTF